MRLPRLTTRRTTAIAALAVTLAAAGLVFFPRSREATLYAETGSAVLVWHDAMRPEIADAGTPVDVLDRNGALLIAPYRVRVRGGPLEGATVMVHGACLRPPRE